MKSVDDVMTHEVRTVRSSEVVGPIRDLMLEGSIHAVPVLDDAGALAGIVTSSDLVEEWQPEQGVTTVMSPEVHTVRRTATVADAAHLMLEHRIHHLVVTDEAGVVGIVSSFDLLRALVRDVEAPATATTGGRRTAKPGDHVVIRGHAIGTRERRGVITEVRGAGGGPPYLVRWLDDPHAEPHDVLFFPSSDADIEPAEG